MLNLHSEENVLFTGEVILSLRLEFCLFHYTSKIFSPLLRVWLWDWEVCFELGCPIFPCIKSLFSAEPRSCHEGEIGFTWKSGCGPQRLCSLLLL